MSAITETIPIAAVIVSAVAAMSSAGLALLGRRISKLKATNESEAKERDYKTEVRLSLVHAILMREVDRCMVFRSASALLVFSQFVVGGILASSFITKNLGDGIVGFFGIIVLGASLINQHFRPDLLHKVSADKLRRLRTLKRKLEDKLYVATRADVSDADLIAIRLSATESLEEIEASEHRAIQNEKHRSA